MSTHYILAIDIGNTNITIGIFEYGDLAGSWRISTDSHKTEDEYALLISSIIDSSGFDSSDIVDSVICSVVPDITSTMRNVCEGLTNVEPLIVNSGIRTGVKINYDRTQDVGADRIMDALAVKTLYSCPAVVVDIGTATVFNALTDKGDYVGGAIAPGLQMSINALYNSTAMLRKVEFEPPECVIGRNTVASIQSGILYGFADLIEGIVGRFKKELCLGDESNCQVIATGGMLSIVAPLVSCFDIVDADLTLKGLNIAYNLNRELSNN